jgi:hypothetical protein
MSSALEIVGGGFAGLVRAVDESRRGARVDYVEPGLRVGGLMATETFLSPFRFNLGPSLVARPPLPSLQVLEPQLLLDVGGSTLTRAAIKSGGGSALRAAFGLLLGIDPLAPTADERIAEACAAIDDLVLVAGGNGLAAACLVDELVAAGSTVVEGVGATVAAPPRGDGLGICRLFIGARGGAPVGKALAIAVGFSDDDSLRAGLDALRSGETHEPFGFLVSNAHLDANSLDTTLWSAVFQGVLPFEAPVSRGEYTDRVLSTLDIDSADVVFRLLWLPEDTGEALR